MNYVKRWLIIELDYWKDVIKIKYIKIMKYIKIIK